MKPTPFYAVTLSTFLLFCLAFPGGAAELTPENYLNTAMGDPDFKAQENLCARIQKEPASLPWIKEMELRVDIDTFEKDKQQYGIRVTPRGLTERALEIETFEQSKILYSLRKEALAHQAVLKRYQMIIDYISYTNRLKLKRALFNVYQDRVEFLKQSGHTRFNIEAILEADKKSDRLTLDILGLENKLGSLKKRIRLGASSNERINFNPAALIKISRIREKARASADGSDSGSIEVKRARIKARLARLNYDQAQARPWLNFIQASWDMDENQAFDKAFSIEFGITLPFFNKNSADAFKKEINALVDQNSYMALKRMIAEKKAEAAETLIGCIARYEGYRNVTGLNMQAFQTPEPDSIEGGDPGLRLALKEFTLEQQIRLSELTESVYTAYVDLLVLTGDPASCRPENLLAETRGANL